MMDPDKGLTIHEACALWPCSVSTMRRMIRNGTVRYRHQTSAATSPLIFIRRELLEDREAVTCGQPEAAPLTLEAARRELQLIRGAA